MKNSATGYKGMPKRQPGPQPSSAPSASTGGRPGVLRKEHLRNLGARKAGRLPSQCLCLFLSKPKSGVSRILVLFPLEADHAWGPTGPLPQVTHVPQDFFLLRNKKLGFVKMKRHSSKPQV